MINSIDGDFMARPQTAKLPTIEKELKESLSSKDDQNKGKLKQI